MKKLLLLIALTLFIAPWSLSCHNPRPKSHPEPSNQHSMVLTIGKSSPDEIIRVMGAPTKTQNSPNNTKTLTFSLTGRALKVFVDKGSRDHDYVIMMNQKDQIQAVFNRGVLVSLSKIIPGPKNPPRRKR